MELLTRLSGAFDPATQRARDNEQADRSLANTQLMTQAQQLQDAQNRINTLHAQLFNLCSKLYDSQCACDKADLHVEMLQSQISGSHRKLCLLPPKRKSLMHKHYPDGGQSIRWLSDEEFPPYENLSIEEDLDIRGPSCTGRAVRKSLSASHHLTIMHHLQAAKDTTVDDEPASVMCYGLG
jgi:hypothetical protein